MGQSKQLSHSSRVAQQTVLPVPGVGHELHAESAQSQDPSTSDLPVLELLSLELHFSCFSSNFPNDQVAAT